MFKIGSRTVKTAIGVVLAIYIAEYFHLNHYMSAGIIALLCIQVTKHQSLKNSWERLLSCVIAIGLSVLFFYTFGYQVFVTGLLLLVFIPITVMLKVQS